MQALRRAQITARSFSTARYNMVKVGDKIPAGTFKIIRDGAPTDVPTSEVFDGKKVVVLGVPGAFTPTCSNSHLPGYIEKDAEIKNKGVDSIICLSVNDCFVMDAWSKDVGATGKVDLYADGGATWHKAADLAQDLGDFGGPRAQRYSMVVENGEIKSLNVEPAAADQCSFAPNILKQL
ncbi:hypothetical protein SARC_00949 [Sphaeroforma arctica JP610]|uniref:Thioredoxin domain-containing protein n=1 Tax=Sphaeroforma arctica JP610 TaxID=667725 RepID=A0A0L0GDC1_9EUKA|nr:hypothetical protein SARC_00949 [Sphaeroforma arctica JP610]KNC86904.1 hypothetical protein SARC_00949 [Sphaeroforma arctica JP610]|eukprot:XP_014160806.1 hypothetical protein SARC_00949 [Sphaeroforma arctica JP610]